MSAGGPPDEDAGCSFCFSLPLPLPLPWPPFEAGAGFCFGLEFPLALVFCFLGFGAGWPWDAASLAFALAFAFAFAFALVACFLGFFVFAAVVVVDDVVVVALVDVAVDVVVGHGPSVSPCARCAGTADWLTVIVCWGFFVDPVRWQIVCLPYCWDDAEGAFSPGPTAPNAARPPKKRAPSPPAKAARKVRVRML